MRTLLLFVLLTGPLPIVAQTPHNKDTDISPVVQRAVVYHPAIRAAAERYEVNPYLLWTIAYLETRFRPTLVSHKGARGLMQFIPATGRRYGLLTRADLHDPLRSIDAAARYVKDLNTMFDGRIDLVLAGYNAGENAVIRSGYKVPAIRETLSYVSRGVALFRNISENKILSQDYPERAKPSGNNSGQSFPTRVAADQQPDRSKTVATHSIYFPK